MPMFNNISLLGLLLFHFTLSSSLCFLFIKLENNQVEALATGTGTGTCGPTCDSWCDSEPLPENINCFHPNPEECVGEFCCITCSSFLQFIADENPSCTCEQFGGECYSNNCSPCIDSCLPDFLKDHEGPLGTGLLCVTDRMDECEPCCQNEHDVGCKLECPCVNPASDCGKDGKVVDYRRLKFV